jgi:signal transduction histidine kinase
MKLPILRHKAHYSLSTKICLFLLPFVLGVFVYALGDLFLQSRRILRQEAIEHANCELGNTVSRVASYMTEVEVISRNTKWQLLNHLEPDSLLDYTHRIVLQNPDINGCVIALEPYFFPEKGRGFSVYSVRFQDSILTSRESEYRYYEKEWYKSVRESGQGVWINPFDDYKDGSLSSPDVITSYNDPIYTPDGQFVGVLSMGLSLQWLSKVLLRDKPYENAYCVMLGKEGKFLVHPDSTKLMNKTIFDDVDPLTQSDMIALGHEMMAQKSGYMQVNIDGEDCYVFYQPMGHTNWSIALVCSESDIFRRYNRLLFILLPLLGAGLVCMFFFCRKIVAFFIKPLGTLERQTGYIADGHFDKPLERSRRNDVVGRLQNSFVVMQESLSRYVHHLERVNSETARHNEELKQANLLAEEAAERQTAFLQDVLHQVRTPLNIIMGFVQVLRDDYTMISKDDVAKVTETMQANANVITRIVDMLVASSAIDGGKTIEQNDDVKLADLIREAESIYNARSPHVTDLVVDSRIDENMVVHTHKEYLMKIVNELLFNAKKFTANGQVLLRTQTVGAMLQIIVEDQGPGIPLVYRKKIFTQFSKINSFSVGLGLGLSISKHFAVLLGGDLWLDDAYEDGARFVLEIPIK